MHRGAPVTPDVAPRELPPVAETLPATIAKLVREVNLEQLLLFGSYACGEPTPGSDVDLLVMVKTGEGKSYRER